MTQWEQLKKEYREIQVPVNGPQQVLRAVEEAKRKRNRWKNFARYGSVAAAAVLVVLLIPEMGMFFGGFGAANEDCAYVESECVTERTGADGSWSVGQSSKDNMAPASAPTTESEEVMDTDAGMETTAPEYGVAKDYKITTSLTDEQEQKQKISYFSEEVRKQISEEIIRQMKERMLTNNETYYVKSEAIANGFELITENQEYYFNEDGLLVIIFMAGSVAPQEQGVVEFIIPAEVFSP